MSEITIDTHGNKAIEREAEEGGLKHHPLDSIAIGKLVIDHPELAFRDVADLEVDGWSITATNRALSGEPIDGTLIEPAFLLHASKDGEEYDYQVRARIQVTVTPPETPEQLAEHTGA